MCCKLYLLKMRALFIFIFVLVCMGNNFVQAQLGGTYQELIQTYGNPSLIRWNVYDEKSQKYIEINKEQPGAICEVWYESPIKGLAFISDFPVKVGEGKYELRAILVEKRIQAITYFGVNITDLRNNDKFEKELEIGTLLQINQPSGTTWTYSSEPLADGENHYIRSDGVQADYHWATELEEVRIKSSLHASEKDPFLTKHLINYRRKRLPVSASKCKDEVIFPRDAFEAPAKPVIHLYPEKTTDVQVKLDYDGDVWVTWPEWKQNSWNVTAEPGGMLTDKKDGRKYRYLFWEARSKRLVTYDWSRSWVIKGTETAEFLRKTLLQMGLNEDEMNEFIVYWYPRMKENPYNQIIFLGKEYAERARLSITPKPDSLLRVFMVYRPLLKEEKVTPPAIMPFDRKGFVAVEWGGAEAIIN